MLLLMMFGSPCSKLMKHVEAFPEFRKSLLLFQRVGQRRILLLNHPDDHFRFYGKRSMAKAGITFTQQLDCVTKGLVNQRIG
ncbi:hypothetical protein AYM40_06590 [Paraburkholderia phytofirmans OLGA172]|uniref:Uncharacterized protein n=1 Tax=Paraburkholderia phytofirmans OLGA172 TaxID=1417228 RepID=A0A160FIS1_9BURK|nr:hypothetical protein AYM40_06590 [Paraburkholderia phytofirmans OLGA172]